MLENWINFLKIPNNRFLLIWLTILFGAFWFIFKMVLNYSLFRPTFTISDPLHNLITPIDFSLIIFLLTEGSLILGIIILIKNPYIFTNAVLIYLIQNLLRVYCIYLVPLAAPKGIIYLNDPFLNEIFYEGREIKTDLFFSGHVSNLFLMSLFLKNNYWRIYFWLVSLTVGFLLIIQRVHYTIDILFAPIASVIVYYGYRWISRKISAK